MEDENARMNREKVEVEAMNADVQYRRDQSSLVMQEQQEHVPPKAEEKSLSSSHPHAQKKPISSRHSLLDFGNVLQSTYRELRHFIMSPLANSTIARCYIERNRSGKFVFPLNVIVLTLPIVKHSLPSYCTVVDHIDDWLAVSS